MKILFLDDDPMRHASFTEWTVDAVHCSDAITCIKHLGSDDWDLVFLDHDLGGSGTYEDPDQENCGTTVVKWCRHQLPAVQHFVVHTMNPPAATNMIAILRDAGYSVSAVPWSIMPRWIEAVLEAAG